MPNVLIIALLILAGLGVAGLIVWAFIDRNDEGSGYHWTDTDF